MKFEDVGRGYYCGMQQLGLLKCPCIKRTSCVGCKTGRRRKFKTIRKGMHACDIIDFGLAVLEQEKLGDWSITIVEGDEGFCRKSNKTILFGKDAKYNFKLMLYEIAHCLTDSSHSSSEFIEGVKRLKKKYLKNKKRARIPHKPRRNE